MSTLVIAAPGPPSAIADTVASWVLSFRSRARQTLRTVSASTPPSANDLMRRVQRGDQEAFAAFYDELSARVFGVVKRVLRDRAMSEEVTQEIFVELWTQAGRFDADRGNASTWALTIARRRAVDRVRREQSQRNRIEELGHQRTTGDDGPAEMVVSRLAAGRLRDAVDGLPEDQREVVVMSFIDGQSHGDIAAELDLPLGTVKGRARGGLKRLRNELGDLS